MKVSLLHSTLRERNQGGSSSTPTTVCTTVGYNFICAFLWLGDRVILYLVFLESC